jgi:hypothetical protein
MANETLVRVTTFSTSGLPRDRFVNDFAWIASGALTQSICDDIADDINTSFYNQVTAGISIDKMLSPVVDRSANKRQFDFYDVSGALGGGSVGSPAFQAFRTVGAHLGGADGLPSQIAACVSFHADTTGLVELGPVVTTLPTPDRAQDMGAPATHSGHTKPKSRRRGRVYIGPLDNAQVTTAGTGGEALFVFGAQGALQGAGAGLLADSPGEWAVWSRRDAAMQPVIGGFVDNAPDTVRHRASKANGRVTF